MPKPWEKYQQQAAPAAGPWAKYQQQAAPDGTAAPPAQSWGEWLIDKVALPHEEIAGAVGQQIRRGGEAAMALPGQATELARSTFTVPAKTLAADVGIPVGEISPQEDAAFRSVMINLLMTLGGGKAGQAIGSRVGDAAKYLGRGFRTAIGVERDLPLMTTAAGSRMAAARDLLSPVISGYAANRVTDWLNPASPFGGGEFGDAIIAGGAGTGVGALVARNTLTDLMTTNPAWRSLMMSPSRGETGQLLGALIGYLLAQGAGDLMGGEQPNAAPDMPHGFYRPGTPVKIPEVTTVRR